MREAFSLLTLSAWIKLMWGDAVGTPGVMWRWRSGQRVHRRADMRGIKCEEIVAWKHLNDWAAGLFCPDFFSVSLGSLFIHTYWHTHWDKCHTPQPAPLSAFDPCHTSNERRVFYYDVRNRLNWSGRDGSGDYCYYFFFWANHSLFYCYRGKTIQIGQLFSEDNLHRISREDRD